MTTAILAVALLAPAQATPLHAATVNQTKQKSTVSAWKLREIPKCFMSASLPTDAKPYAPPFSDPTGRVKRTEWAIATVADAQIQFIYSAYKPSVKVDVLGALDSGLDALKRLPGARDFKVQKKQVTLNGISGWRMRVDFVRNVDPAVYWVVAVGKDTRMWQVSSSAYADNLNLGAIQRVLDSVQIKP